MDDEDRLRRGLEILGNQKRLLSARHGQIVAHPVECSTGRPLGAQRQQAQMIAVSVRDNDGFQRLIVGPQPADLRQ
jgi:hypothetical protein